jgi:SAM-dependent methyltransferase
MLDDPDSGPLPSRILQERYGRGYFHGEGSGFSREGYGREHATWTHWMDFVRAEMGPGARWLDLGCAYGFLVSEARAAGFRAVGVDASRFATAEAVRWADPAIGHLTSAHAERLPFAASAFDVVSAFDLLEHVPEPSAVVAEAARVLRPGGLFVAATPDRLAFDRHEPTHVAEAVPSWWVHELERAGFAVSLRFFQAAFNCELVARRGGPAPRICIDRLGSDEPVLRLHGDGRLGVALRSGFGEVLADGSRIVSDGAMVYLLNRGGEPLIVDLAITLDEASSLTLQLDGQVVARRARAGGGANVGSERSDGRAGGALPGAPVPLLLPAGGHPLRIALGRGWAHLRQIELRARPGDRAELLTGLPFDLYERYALAAEVVARVAPDAARLLDVGGTMGGDAGHLAWTGDFFPDRPVVVADTRPADYPEHVVVGPEVRLPFPDRAFSVVMALDVLEHVPPGERRQWLAEVWRVTDRILLLGNPFATPGVAEADRFLFDLIRSRYGYEHGFLAEHLAHGHPDLDETRRFFAECGAGVALLPSGYLPAWALLQTLNALLSHPEQDWTFTRANRIANRSIGLASCAEPAYRHLLVVDRSGADHAGKLASLVAQRSPDLEAVTAALAALSALEARSNDAPLLAGDAGEGERAR